MVKEQSRKYICEECGFRYKDKRWAEKCEEFCKKYKGCNAEITKHAVKKGGCCGCC
jgi:predicted ATP-dependent serine protease